MSLNLNLCHYRRSMLAYFVTLFLGCLVVHTTQVVAEQDGGVSEPERSVPGLIDFARDIKPIFESKCLGCHGPKKANNDFRVDQVETVLGYIEPSDAQSSSLWTDYLVTDDDEMRMPPIKHDTPLTGVELAAIRTWIDEGATWNDVAKPVEHTPQPPKSALVRFWAFQGYFHPATVHFPVALLMMAAVFGIGSLFFRESFESASFHCLWVGAVAAVFACMMGWSFAETRGYGDPWDFDWNKDPDARHRWLGVALAVSSVAVTLIAIGARRNKSAGLRVVWLSGTLITAALVGVVGHQGGELVYGEGMYDKAIEELLGKPDKPAILPANGPAQVPEATIGDVGET